MVTDKMCMQDLFLQIQSHISQIIKTVSSYNVNRFRTQQKAKFVWCIEEPSDGLKLRLVVSLEMCILFCKIKYCCVSLCLAVSVWSPESNVLKILPKIHAGISHLLCSFSVPIMTALCYQHFSQLF